MTRTAAFGTYLRISSTSGRRFSTSLNVAMEMSSLASEASARGVVDVWSRTVGAVDMGWSIRDQADEKGAGPGSVEDEGARPRAGSRNPLRGLRAWATTVPPAAQPAGRSERHTSLKRGDK